MGLAEKEPIALRRPKVLVALLVLLGILWAVSHIQIADLETELTRVAEKKIRELRGPEERQAFEVAVPVITVSKQFILFGKITGKIAVYMRPTEGSDADSDADEEHTHSPGTAHHHAGGISGIEYFLQKDGAEWIDRESGSCSSEQCQTEGNKAFQTREKPSSPN